MTRFQYWFINGASLLVAILIGLEIRSVHQLDEAGNMAQTAQLPVLQAQQEAPQIQRMIQRTAVGATRDPALKDLLARYGITVKPMASDTAVNPPVAPAVTPTLSTASTAPSSP